MTNKKLDYFKLIISSLIFGSIGVFIKNINIPAMHIVLLRTIIASIFFILIFLLTKNKIDIQGIKKNIFPLFFAGCALGVSWVFLFEAYSRIQISIATLIYYFSPTILILVSPIVFKDKLTIIKIFCVVLSTIGMFLVANIKLNELSENKDIFFALVAAFGYTFLVIFNKKIYKVDGNTTTFVEMIIATVILAIYLLVINKEMLILPTDTISIIFIIIVGIIHTGIACLFYFSAVNKLPTTNVALLTYIDPISALIFSYIFLNEKLSIFQIIGAFLILGTSILVQIPKKNK